MSSSANLHNAKSSKNDEFYTQLADIEKELQHYMTQLKNKVVYCNCDDYRQSKFWEYFHINFSKIGLKRLVATHYSKDGVAFKAIYEGGDDNNITRGIITQLSEDGDFRSKECIDILDESDIVVTNPPFSLFREFVATIVSHGKSFLIIGNKTAVGYKEFFLLLKSNDVRLGYTNTREFLTTEGTIKAVNAGWFTTLDVSRSVNPITLCKSFNQYDYPMFDNYNAWNVDKVADIPINTHFALVVDEERYKSLLKTYGNCCELIETLQETTPEGTTRALYHVKVENPILGVPITFLDKYNPAQFEILGLSQRVCHSESMETKKYDDYWEVRQDGTRTGSSGSKTNGNPNLAVNDGKHNYFINAAGHIVQSCYLRIFIRHK